MPYDDICYAAADAAVYAVYAVFRDCCHADVYAMPRRRVGDVIARESAIVCAYALIRRHAMRR